MGGNLTSRFFFLNGFFFKLNDLKFWKFVRMCSLCKSMETKMLTQKPSCRNRVKYHRYILCYIQSKYQGRTRAEKVSTWSRYTSFFYNLEYVIFSSRSKDKLSISEPSNWQTWKEIWLKTDSKTDGQKNILRNLQYNRTTFQVKSVKLK